MLVTHFYRGLRIIFVVFLLIIFIIKYKDILNDIYYIATLLYTINGIITNDPDGLRGTVVVRNGYVYYFLDLKEKYKQLGGINSQDIYKKKR